MQRIHFVYFSNRNETSTPPIPIELPKTIVDRLNQTSGNFVGMSPTDLNHFDFPPNSVPKNENSYNDRYEKSLLQRIFLWQCILICIY